MIRGSAESIKDGYNNEGDSYDQKGIFSCILPGLLSPEPLEDRQHGNTFGKGTLDMAHAQKLQEKIYHIAGPRSSRFGLSGPLGVLHFVGATFCGPSLVPQCHDWVHPHRAPRWNVACR